VVDLLLLQGVQDLLQELQRVSVAVARGEPVARIARAVADVQVADVAESDDGRSPESLGC
jgi:hypothetical protein